MGIATAIDKSSNRRVAFRIYEQVNLFYHKVDNTQPIQQPTGFDLAMTGLVGSRFESIQPALPRSRSQENDTLNVNISASGIAFTCKDQLQPDDYLMLRILLLSSMTVIMTCCKVVYCKPSNPYEPDRYPYSIGAEFVNMTPADSALLEEFVHKRRNQNIIVNSIWGAIAFVCLAAPIEVFELLEGLAHHIIEIFLEVLHLAFEYLEMGLDHVVEHLFETGTHETQIIVFYTIVTPALIALYFFLRRIPPAMMRWRNQCLLYLSRKKASSLYFWNQQSLISKIKIAGIGTVAVIGYFYLAF